MIVTRQSRVPWSWVWLSQLPFAFWMFAIQFNGTALVFSLRKFVSDPSVIAASVSLASLPVLFIAPVVTYLSDHVWTRWGRRKPFYVASTVVCAGLVAAMPFARSYASLTALFWLYSAGTAFGKTFFPLSQEVIPIPQRGRGSAIHSAMFQVGLLVYYGFVVGRFDDVYFDGPLTWFGALRGETMVYGVCALAMLLPVGIVALGVKELPGPGDGVAPGPRPGLWRFVRGFFADVFDRQWAVLYLLLFGSAVYALGLGPLTGLLYTDQWGYTKQDLGTNVTVGGLILLPFTALIGLVADRFSKMTVYLASLGSALFFNVAYYLFVTFALPDHRPTLWQIVVFGEFTAIFATLTSTVQWPLLFEYIPRAKMGTASAGMEMMSALLTVILAPVGGLWVSGYSHLFLPGPGSEVRVVLRAPADVGTVRAALAAGGLEPGRIFVEPWFAPGQPAGERGLRWAVREPDPAQAANERERHAGILRARVVAALGERLALENPVARAGFAPRKYDYFSAYLLGMVGGTAGIGVVLLIRRLERRGTIRKLGVIEDRERAGAADPVLNQSVPTSPAATAGPARTYTPGYTAAKAALAAAGLGLAAVGIWQNAAPARAALAGGHARATVTEIEKTGPAGTPADDSVFRCRVEVPGVGAGRTALLNVVSRDEAPYRPGDTVPVAFAPGDPVVYAVADLRTWVPGGLLTAFGLAFAAAFTLLWRRARRPIALPPDTPPLPVRHQTPPASAGGRLP